MELGHNLSTKSPRLLGAYNHIYEDNFLDIKGINTHYVVLAFIISLQKEIAVKPDDQHSDLKWWEIDKPLKESTSTRIQRYTLGNHKT